MPNFKLIAGDDGTARVVSADGAPLTLDADGTETPVVVALDGFQAVAPDPLAGLADNPHIKALQERLATAEAAATAAHQAKAEAKVNADADAFHRDLTDAKAPRAVGEIAKTAKSLYAALATADLDAKTTHAADFRAFVMSLPAIDTAEHGDGSPDDATTDEDGDRTLPNRTKATPKDGPLTEAAFKATLASSADGQEILADAGKYAKHLARMKADGLVA